MTYQTLPLSTIPRRKGPSRDWDRAAADQLLAVVSGDMVEGSPPTATDGLQYPEAKLARAVANKAKRLLERVLPDGNAAKTGLFGFGKDNTPILQADSTGKFGWYIFLVPAKPAKATVEPEKEATA